MGRRKRSKMERRRRRRRRKIARRTRKETRENESALTLQSYRIASRSRRSAHTSTLPPQGPPLPWAWIAEHAGISFSQLAFELWLQIRLLGQPYLARHCPWCQPGVPLTAPHLHLSCSTFTYRCFMAGILPAEAFHYPPDAAWMCAAVGTLEPDAPSSEPQPP